MIFSRKYLILIPLALLFFVPNSSHAASVTIKSFDVKQTSIPVQQSTINTSFELDGDLTEIQNKCGSSNDILWSIVDVADPTGGSGGSGIIKQYEFQSSRIYKKDYSFSYQPSANQTFANFQLKVLCDNFLNSQITESAIEKVDVVGHSAGGFSVKFGSNKTNQRVAPGSKLDINFTLSFWGDEANLKSTCRSDSVGWKVLVFPLTSPNNVTHVESGGIKVTDFGTGKQIDRNFTERGFTALSEDFGFRAYAECDKFGSDELATSSVLTIRSGGAGTGSGSTGTTGGTTGGGTTGGGSTGQGASFSFEITNPLKGAPDNFLDLINIITVWLFNLSIPIAVILILYAGFLYLTAGPYPKNVQKAKDILKYTILGLAIIFIGKGFVTLIISVIELGGEETQTGPAPIEAIKFDCDNVGQCVRTPNGRFTTLTCNSQCAAGGKPIGAACASSSECYGSLLKCDGICQRRSGNLEGEACIKPANCKSNACSNVNGCVPNPNR